MADIDFRQTLEGVMVRNQMMSDALAKYLGVSQYTLKNWLDGSRVPGAATLRLVEVLGYVEMFAPDVHRSLLER